MGLPQTPLINGNRHSWASVQASLGSRFYNAFKSINYRSMQEPGKVRGNGTPQVIGRTRGEYDSEGDFELLRDEFQDFVAFLMQGQDRFVGIHDIDFQFNVRYVTKNSPSVFQDILYGARLKKIDSSNQQGTDPSTMKCDLSILFIDWNGLKSVGDIQIPQL